MEQSLKKLQRMVDRYLWKSLENILSCSSCPWQCCNWRRLAIDFNIVFVIDITVDVTIGSHPSSLTTSRIDIELPKGCTTFCNLNLSSPPFSNATHSSSSLSLLLSTCIIDRSLALRYASVAIGTDPGRGSTVSIMISLPPGFILSTRLLMIFFASAFGQS